MIGLVSSCTAAKIYLTRWFFTYKESALPIGDSEAADQDVVVGDAGQGALPQNVP